MERKRPKPDLETSMSGSQGADQASGRTKEMAASPTTIEPDREHLPAQTAAGIRQGLSTTHRDAFDDAEVSQASARDPDPRCTSPIVRLQGDGQGLGLVREILDTDGVAWPERWGRHLFHFIPAARHESRNRFIDKLGEHHQNDALMIVCNKSQQQPSLRR
ncbi:hypothetical protein CSUI_006408 [Cystoisospora suis]|uniref:Uncharacterized protein n=1 Tax=Cystoisospora suis TaxID=483139 RepID=A0A2C6KU17_9APIC|nr:hypothetical protein CSUI_006408 [Cystoisospora suis]